MYACFLFHHGASALAPLSRRATLSIIDVTFQFGCQQALSQCSAQNYFLLIMTDIFLKSTILRLLHSKCFINVKVNVSLPAVRQKRILPLLKSSQLAVKTAAIQFVMILKTHFFGLNVFFHTDFMSLSPKVVFPAARRCCSPQFTVIELLTKGCITKEYHTKGVLLFRIRGPLAMRTAQSTGMLLRWKHNPFCG